MPIQNIENKSQKLFVIKDRSLKKFLLYLTIISGFLGSVFFSYDIGPFSIFPYRIFLPILWIFFILSLFLSHGRLDISKVKVKNYLVFLAIWLSYAFFSVTWALSKPFAIRHLMFLLMAFSVIFFIVYYFSNIKDLKRSYYLWILILVALLLIGMWETLTGNHLPISGLIGAPFVNRYMPSAVFDNSNDFATYIVLSIPFIISLVHYTKNIFIRLFGMVIFSLAFYLLVKTLSRANYIAVIFEFIFLFVFLLNKRTKFKVTVMIGLIILAVVIAIPGSALIQYFFKNNVISQQIQSIYSPWSLQYGSIDVRINLIKNSLIFLLKSLGFGVGAGNAEYYIAHYAVYNTRGILNLHNWWVEILVNYGVFVFIGYIILYYKLFRSFFKLYFRLDSGFERAACETVLLGLAGFLFASTSSSSIIAMRFHWLFFAFTLALLNYFKNKPKEANL